jgi:hypothetical protein
MRPNGWDITWGDQVDPRVVRLTGAGQISDVAVASYVAKYATKSTEPVVAKTATAIIARPAAPAMPGPARSEPAAASSSPN